MPHNSNAENYFRLLESAESMILSFKAFLKEHKGKNQAAVSFLMYEQVDDTQHCWFVQNLENLQHHIGLISIVDQQ